MEWITNPEAWVGLVTLAALEIVLGIDNIVFISILSGKLPVEQQASARRLGLLLAMASRIALLFSISLIYRLTNPLFHLFGRGLSGKDLILIAGGLFLLWKATHEIHQRLEGEEGHASARVAPSFTSVLLQITLLDIVFSLDSVITAVGMVEEIAVMVLAIIVAVGVMLFASGPISAFVERHPTVKMLALSFLLLIGLTLFVEGFHVEIPKGYVYFAMGFSVFVEVLNLRLRGKAKPVSLHEPYTAERAPAAGSS